VETVRVAFRRSLGMPATRLLRHARPGWDGQRLGWLAATSLAAGVGLWMMGMALGAAVLGALAGGAVCGAGLMGVARAARDPMSRLAGSDSLEDLAAAVADGLAAGGVIHERLGAGNVRIAAQPDGYYRCSLDRASADDARAFAVALDEVLAPLWDPRAIIARRVADAPRGIPGVLGVVVRRALGRGPGPLVVYHAVPEALAGTRAKLEAFERAWSHWVSPGSRALRRDDPRAQAVLALRAGDDPFRLETQMRTLWT
jgi:hypothetical protein